MPVIGKNFVPWCADKKKSRSSPCPLSQVLSFALSLPRSGLALRTVKAFLRFPDQPSLFKSPIVLGVLKGLTHNFPPIPFIMPQLDLNLVLTFFMCYYFEPMHSCPLRLLTLKTIFLVAITSARRVSELEAHYLLRLPLQSSTQKSWS